MQTELDFCASFLHADKWISKTDFIYRVKAHCNMEEQAFRNLLRFLYDLPFSGVRKGPDGRITLVK